MLLYFVLNGNFGVDINNENRNEGSTKACILSNLQLAQKCTLVGNAVINMKFRLTANSREMVHSAFTVLQPYLHGH